MRSSLMSSGLLMRQISAVNRSRRCRGVNADPTACRSGVEVNRLAFCPVVLATDGLRALCRFTDADPLSHVGPQSRGTWPCGLSENQGGTGDLKLALILENNQGMTDDELETLCNISTL